MDKDRFIELCKAGDEYALGLLYTTYAPRMKRLCLRYVGDEATAEDIVHDGFIIIMSSIHQLKDASKLDSWMATILRNLAIRHLGRNGKTIFIPIEDVEESEDFACETLEIVSEYKELLRLIETLPNGYKSVFKLSVFEEMSHKEIGKLLGINPHSSSSQLARAKEMLRILVTKYGFIPILIIALLYAIQPDGPKDIQRKVVTKNDVERKENVAPINKNIQDSVPKRKDYQIGIAIATHEALEAVIDTITVEKADTAPIEMADSTKEENKIVLPNVNSINMTNYGYNPGTREMKENEGNWLASVSFSGGMATNSSVFTSIPNMGSDIGGEETVETKTHHYMPFVVSLSLQKSLGNNWSIGTGLCYTRLKTDITTIGEYETNNETQKVEYIGIPLNLNYNLWRTGHLSFYTSAGITANIPVSGSKTWQWSLSIGAGMQYQLTPSVSLFAEPSLNYHLNSNHGTPTIWTDRPFDITVPLGLRLSW